LQTPLCFTPTGWPSHLARESWHSDIYVRPSVPQIWPFEVSCFWTELVDLGILVVICIWGDEDFKKPNGLSIYSPSLQILEANMQSDKPFSWKIKCYFRKVFWSVTISKFMKMKGESVVFRPSLNRCYFHLVKNSVTILFRISNTVSVPVIAIALRKPVRKRMMCRLWGKSS
jgi:hypothetical protein